MSSTLGKILLFLGIITVIGMLGFVIYNQHQLSVQQTAIQTEQVAQRQLINGIVGAQTTWATKQDVAGLLAANGINAQALAAIQADMSNLKATLTTGNVVVVNSNPQQSNNQPSSGTGPVNPNPPAPAANNCPNPDPFGFMKAQQNYTLNEQFGTLQVPFGVVGFSAWQQDPWSVNIPARQYTINNVIGTDENQRNYVYNQVNVKVNGQNYTVPIASSTTQQVYPGATWSWWNPRLLMGADGGVNVSHIQGEFTPTLNLGIMSYGQYKTTPDFSILEVGVGYQTVNKKASVTLTPAAYNFGRNLLSPLMNNTYVAPSISIATDGSWTVGAGLRVGF